MHLYACPLYEQALRTGSTPVRCTGPEHSPRPPLAAMPRPLSADLVHIIVEKRLFHGETIQKVATDTLTSVSTVSAVVKRVYERGGFETWQGHRVGLPGNAKLDRAQRLDLLELIITVDADVTLEGIAALFFEAHQVHLTVPDMSRAMVQMNQTYKTVRSLCPPNRPPSWPVLRPTECALSAGALVPIALHARRQPRRTGRGRVPDLHL